MHNDENKTGLWHINTYFLCLQSISFSLPKQTECITLRALPIITIQPTRGKVLPLPLKVSCVLHEGVLSNVGLPGVSGKAAMVVKGPGLGWRCQGAFSLAHQQQVPTCTAASLPCARNERLTRFCTLKPDGKNPNNPPILPCKYLPSV